MSDSQVKNELRARSIMQDKLQTIGINPVIHVWSGENRAYVSEDEETFNPVLAEYFGCPLEEVDEFLWLFFEDCKEIAAEVIREETEEIIDINDGSQEYSWLHIWENPDGWYFCYSGTKDGLYSESDDVGPFDDRDEAYTYATSTTGE